MADARDLKSLAPTGASRFESGLRHHIINSLSPIRACLPLLPISDGHDPGGGFSEIAGTDDVVTIKDALVLCPEIAIATRSGTPLRT